MPVPQNHTRLPGARSLSLFLSRYLNGYVYEYMYTTWRETIHTTLQTTSTTSTNVQYQHMANPKKDRELKCHEIPSRSSTWQWKITKCTDVSMAVPPGKCHKMSQHVTTFKAFSVHDWFTWGVPARHGCTIVSQARWMVFSSKGKSH